jgi:hypothetical protein
LFLDEWKDQAGRVIYQYATEKMSPAKRERFRRRTKPAVNRKAASHGSGA